MTKNFLPPWPHYENEQINAAINVLKNGKVNYWTGKECRSFENEFANFVDTKHAISLSNGSLALSAAYLAIGLGPGDELITTPRTFIATASSAVLLGAKPVFADVDPDSGAITAETIAPLINKKTKAISVVHLGGWPADMPAICDLAKSKNILVIEDCAQAHGARINGKSVGSFGAIGVWSFCQEKIISTGGEGGMVTTSSDRFWDLMWSFKDHGKNFESVISEPISPGFRWIHERFGSNFRLTEFQSAIGRVQLMKLPNWLMIRRRNAHILHENLCNHKSLRVPFPPKEIDSAWYKFYAFLDPKALLPEWDRDRIVSEIKSLGYPAFSGSCSEIYLENCFKKANLMPTKRLKVARYLGETSLMFLIHPTISEDQIYLYSEAILKVLNIATR